MLTEVEEAPVASFAKTILRYQALQASGDISAAEYTALLNSIKATLTINAQAEQLENTVALANAVDTLLAVTKVASSL